MFKKFFNVAVGFVKSIPGKIKNFPMTIKSGIGWIKGIYSVMVEPFIKRMCMFVTSWVSPMPKTAK